MLVGSSGEVCDHWLITTILLHAHSGGIGISVSGGLEAGSHTGVVSGLGSRDDVGGESIAPPVRSRLTIHFSHSLEHSAAISPGVLGPVVEWTAASSIMVPAREFAMKGLTVSDHSQSHQTRR